MNEFEKVLHGVSKQSGPIFIGRISLFILNFFSGVLLARLLGANLLGIYQLGLVIVQFMGILCVVGFDKGLIRFIPIFNLDNKGKIKSAIYNNLIISFVLSICFSILLYVNSSLIADSFFHSSDMANVLEVFSFYLPFFSLFILCSAVLNGFKKADVESNIVNIISPAFFIICLGLIFIYNGKLYSTILARIITHVITIGFMIGYIYWKYSDIFSLESVPYGFKRFLSFSLPLSLTGIFYFLLGQTDILMLGYFLAPTEVGTYSVAVRISMITIMGLEVVNATFTPYISELKKKDDIETMEKLLKVLTKWIFYISLFIFTIIFIFRIEILNIFGHTFINGTTALVILAIGQLVNAFSGPTGKILIMTGKQKWEVLNSIAMFILNIILNLLLIPKFGINGAAIATTLSLSTINVLKLIETYIEFKFHPYSFRYFKGILSIIIGAIVAFIFHYLLTSYRLNFIFVVVSGSSILFLTTLLIFYYFKFDPEDKVIFNKLVGY